MRSQTVVGAVLLFLAVLVATVAARDRSDVHTVPVADNVFDNLILMATIGRPSRTYRLKVAFDVNTTGSGYFAPAQIVLFRSHDLRDRSATYETVIVDYLGRDIVQIGGTRWRGLIASHTDPNESTCRCDGYLVLRLDDPFLRTTAYLTQLQISRRGFHYDMSGKRLGMSLAKVECPLKWPPEAVALHAASSLIPSDVSVIGEISTAMYSGVAYRLLIAPSSRTTYLPYGLFQHYFQGRNLYVDSPYDWPPLAFTLQDPNANDEERPDITLSISGYAMLPTKRSPSLIDGSDGGRRFSLAEFDEGVASGELQMRGGVTLGFDALKVRPHDMDNTTVVIGGNVFWLCAGIQIIQGQSIDDVRLSLVMEPTGPILSMVEAIVLIIVGLFYVYWKLVGFWIDVTADRWRRYGRYYFTVVASTTFVCPSLFALILYGSVFAYRWGSANTFSANQHVARTVAIAGWAFWAFLFALMCLDRFRVSRAIYRTFWHIGTTCSRAWSQAWSNARVHRELDRTSGLGSSKPYIPYYDHVKREDRGRHAGPLWATPPRYEERKRNADFVWTPLPLTVLHDTFVDVLVVATLWLLVAPLDANTFVLLVLFSAHTFLLYASFHRMFVFYFALSWPAVYWRRWPPRYVMLLWLVVATIATLTAWFTIDQIVLPLVDTASLIYGGSTAAATIAASYVFALLFLAAATAQRTLVAHTVSRPV